MKHTRVRLMETFADVSVNTNVSVQDTKISSTNINQSKTSTDINNSQQNTSTSTVNTSNVNTQQTSNVSNIDNSTKSNIVSSSNTSNVDNSTSSTINDNSILTNNIVKCGFDAAGAKDLVANINDSININNNASNSFIVTGNNNTISDIKLSSMLTSYGPSIDKKCVQEAVNKSLSQQSANNSNSKSAVGGSTDFGLTTGGNTTANTSATSSENTNKNVSESSSKALGESAVQATTVTSQKATSEQSSVQDSKQGASSLNGLYDGVIFCIILVIFVSVMYAMEQNGGSPYYTAMMDFVNENQLLTMVSVGSALYYFFRK